MKITINNNRKIHAVQEEFNKVYPYLKLEFFAKSNTAGGNSSEKLIRNDSKTMADCRTEHNNGELVITEDMNVAELEQRFRDIFGITIQVLRKSGNVWLETSKTQNWTLGDQNKQGESLEYLG
jgi:hypothetical protein